MQRVEETPPTLSFSNRFGPKDTGTFHCCPPLTYVAFGSSTFSDMTIFTNSFSAVASSPSSFFCFSFFFRCLWWWASLSFSQRRLRMAAPALCPRALAHPTPGTNIDHRRKGRRGPQIIKQKPIKQKDRAKCAVSEAIVWR